VALTHRISGSIRTVLFNKTSDDFNNKIPKPIRDISYDSAQNVILIFLSFDIGWSFNAMSLHETSILLDCLIIAIFLFVVYLSLGTLKDKEADKRNEKLVNEINHTVRQSMHEEIAPLIVRIDTLIDEIRKDREDRDKDRKELIDLIKNINKKS
jgi:hypothetical protein